MLELTLTLSDMDWASLRAFVAAGEGLPGDMPVLVSINDAGTGGYLSTFIQPGGH